MRMRTLLLLAAACLAAACGHTAGTVAGGGRGEAPDTIAAGTPPDSLLIRVSMVTTKRGDVIPVSNDFRLLLHGDSVSSDLPYFGRAYSAPIGTESVLRFDARMTGFTSARTGSGATRMEFSVRTVEDTFRFRVELRGNGRAYIGVQPMRRDRISFDGDVDGDC